jgi:hypothetical protein
MSVQLAATSPGCAGGILCMWMIQRIAYPDLGVEMNNLAKAILGEKRLHAGTIGQIQLHETKSGVALQYFKPRLFQPWVLLVVDDVDTNDLTTGCE